ncbi:hypothetical protein [Arthrobacter cupressi]
MTGHFVHEATVMLSPGSDTGAPGAKITVSLCGRWEHPPPCPLAAHHTSQDLDGPRLRLRTVFTTEPAREDEVRRLIERALRQGTMEGPDGSQSRWTLLTSQTAELTAAEHRLAKRLSADGFPASPQD